MDQCIANPIKCPVRTSKIRQLGSSLLCDSGYLGPLMVLHHTIMHIWEISCYQTWFLMYSHFQRSIYVKEWLYLLECNDFHSSQRHLYALPHLYIWYSIWKGIIIIIDGYLKLKIKDWYLSYSLWLTFSFLFRLLLNLYDQLNYIRNIKIHLLYSLMYGKVPGLGKAGFPQCALWLLLNPGYVRSQQYASSPSPCKNIYR